jgi:hypothetical protein
MRAHLLVANTFLFSSFHSSYREKTFMVTMAIQIPPTTCTASSQRKMIIVSLVVGIVLLSSLTVDAVEDAVPSIGASARKASHSSGRSRQRSLRSRRVENTQPPVPINNEPDLSLAQLGLLGILPVTIPETIPENETMIDLNQWESPSIEENATFPPPPAGEAGEYFVMGEQGEAVQPTGKPTLAAALPKLTVPAPSETQGNEGQNSGPAGANNTQSAQGGDNNTISEPPLPEAHQGMVGILPVIIPQDQDATVQGQTPVQESAALAPSGESGAQEPAGTAPPVVPAASPIRNVTPNGGGAPPPGANSQGGGAPPPGPSPPEEKGQAYANTLPTGNGNQGGNANDQNHNEGNDGKALENDDRFGTIPLAADDDVLDEIQQVERKVRTIGGFGIFLAIVAMIFTAWQMSDNPDGFYAAMCRLVITIIGLVMRILLSPCRSCLGGHHGGRNYAGHMPVSTMDYGYRDPALELS